MPPKRRHIRTSSRCHQHLAFPQKNDDQSKVAFRDFRGKVNGQLDIYADGVTPPEKIVDMRLRGLIPEWKTNEYRTPNFEVGLRA